MYTLGTSLSVSQHIIRLANKWKIYTNLVEDLSAVAMYARQDINLC